MTPPRTFPRGLRNHNPGNIDRRPGVRWQGQASDQSGDPRFVVFEAPKWGIRAIARILITYQDARQARDGSRIDTVREIVDRWAPPGENDAGAYSRHVAALTAIGEDETLDVYDFATAKALVKAIIQHENGGNPYSDIEIEAGLRLAGIEPPARPLAKQADVIATTSATGLTLLAAALQEGPQVATQAAQAAQSVAPFWPGAAKWLLLGLVVLLLLIATVKQVRDHRTGARS